MARLTIPIYAGFIFVQVLLSTLLIYHLHHSSWTTPRQPREYEWGLTPNIMRGCPMDWPLEILVKDDYGEVMSNGMSNRNVAQVCRNKNGDWKCAKGWQRIEDESRCVNSTQPQIIPSTESPKVIRRSSVRQPKYAPVSDDRKLLFIHIPKAGGTTIETSFLFDDKREELQGAYLGGHNKIIAFDEEFFKSYHKFSMVRHPCSRLISTWGYYSQGLGNAADRRWVAEHLDERSLSSFDLFVIDTLYPGGTLKVTNQIHLQPQVNMIFNERGEFALDQLLVFEKWNESFDSLSKQIHADLSPLKTSHKLSSKHDDCQSAYTLKAWEKMTEIYAMDFCVLGYSSNINEITTTPLLGLTSDYLTHRYEECAKKLIQGAVDTAEFQKVRLPVDKDVSHSELNSDSCTIYTYYEPTPKYSPSALNSDQKTLNAWKVAWSVAGWTPMTHPDYLSFRERFSKLPTTNSREYEMACFMRHVAMAAVGGGWMSDYDVIPFHFPPCSKPFNDGMYTVYMGYTPSIVSASAIEFTRVANRMANVRWEDQPQLFSYQGVSHVSDMFVIRKLIDEKAMRTMRVVMEAKQLFNHFSCENSLGYSSIPKGMSSFPWAVHFSHSSLAALGKSNLSSFWPGSIWNSVKLHGNIETMRSAFMSDAARYLRKTCLTDVEKLQ